MKEIETEIEVEFVEEQVDSDKIGSLSCSNSSWSILRM